MIILMGLFGQVQAQPGGSIGDSVATFIHEENLSEFLGFGISVVERGRDDYSDTYGFADHEEIRPFTDSTIFNLGSVSKLFTAISIMRLVDEEAISLNDPVYIYFPEFLEIQGKSRFASQITILDLLQHRSGIFQSMEDLYPELFGKGSFESEDEFYDHTFNYRAFMSREDFLNRFLMYARIDKKPKGKYQFSNLGFVILGYILQEITGLNLGQFVTNKIFAPLGMNDSHYYQTPDSMKDRLAMGYYRLEDGSYLNIHENEVESPSPTGDGGIKTSLRDMKKFMKFLVGGYGEDVKYRKILPRARLMQMIGPQKRGPDKRTWIGLGFHNMQPYNFAGHAGGWDGYLAILYYHPDSHSCLFLISNREDNQLFSFLTIWAAYAMLHRRF